MGAFLQPKAALQVMPASATTDARPPCLSGTSRSYFTLMHLQHWSVLPCITTF